MDKKIKKSFGKVKADFLKVNNEILDVRVQLNKLSKKNEVGIDIQAQLNRLEKVDLERFVVNMEKEFRSINVLIKSFNSKFEENSKFMEKFNFELEKYHTEIKDLKKKITNTQSKTENTNLDVEVLNSKFSDIQELLNEKIDLQNAALRMEMMEEISKLYNQLGNQVARNERIEFESSKPPKPSKLEKKVITSNKEIKKKSQNKEEGKFKKAVKWLFVDDDEDETIDSIKDEVKKN